MRFFMAAFCCFRPLFIRRNTQKIHLESEQRRPTFNAAPQHEAAAGVSQKVIRSEVLRALSFLRTQSCGGSAVSGGGGNGALGAPASDEPLCRNAPEQDARRGY